VSSHSTVLADRPRRYTLTMMLRLRMTIVGFAVSVAAFSSLLCAPANAQWINYPTRGIPRAVDGKPNLAAPTPKTPDGKPDFSGVWEQQNSRASGYYLNGIDIPWQPWAKALFDQNTADNQINNPESKCLPRGTPKADAFDLHKIIQTPELIIILYEYQTTYRQIFLDGRELPKDPNPTWAGYSTGHWEGDMLVVESNGFNGKAWLSGRGNPTSDGMRLTERMRRRDFGHLDIQLTIDDPKAYTKPWKAELHPELIPDTELMEFVCNENERDLRHLIAK
jgi:hypothetical protein